VHAFDVSADAIASARSRYDRPNLHFAVHDATQPFPLPDASVDVVFSSEVVEHLARGREFFRAAANMLKPGGLIVLKTPNDDYNRLENRLNPFHTNPYTARRLRAELAECFEDVRVDGLTYRQELVTATESRPDPEPPERMPYAVGDPILVDRVMTVRLQVTPTWVPATAREVPEYLVARARRPLRTAS